MTTTRIKEKISKLVSSQLPEFIQTDYPTFISFIEAYYKFLEQDQGAFELIQNSRSYYDIDKTTSAFISYFLKNYADIIPADILADRKFLVKRIKDLYESKGSELSFKILFRLLFNADVEVKYPFEFVLRASDGRWQQNNSLRLRTISGDRSNILNRFLAYTSNGVTYNTPIIETKELTSTLTETFLDSNFLAPTYTLGDTVQVYSGSNVIFSGSISPTPVDYNISQPGVGFKLGQIYTINYGGGVDTLIKISNVSTTGGVQEIKFISYGYGFDSNSTVFTVDIDPTRSVTTSLTSDILSDRTLGFSESFTATILDINAPNRYFDSNTYVSGIYTISGNSSVSADAAYTTFTPLPITTSENFCKISFNLGSFSRYPGSFYTNNGFLSEPDVRLQDNLLFQPFAYQTNTDIDYSTFFQAVKGLIHPAGQNLFNNRTISASIDITSNIVLLPTSNIFLEFYDSFEPYDSTFTTRLLTVNDISELLDDVEKQLSLPNAELLNVDDNNNLQINLPILENLSTTDVNLVERYLFLFLEEFTGNNYCSINYFEGDYVDQSPGIPLSDNNTLSVSSQKNEIAQPNDSSSISSSTSQPNEILGTTDAFSIERQTQAGDDFVESADSINLNILPTLNNIASTNESGSIANVSYALNYFAEFYNLEPITSF